MITGAELLKFLHILSAFWLVSGIVGRNLASGQAAKVSNMENLKSLLLLVDRFDVLMVRPGSFAVLLAGILTARQQGWPLLGFIEGSSSDWLLVSLVIYLGVFLLVPLVFIPRGKVFAAAMANASAAGAITPELRGAMHDRVVFAAHGLEALAIALVIFLMVTKPF